MLVATSNRSEVAVGYATMDGDTAGGIAPIAGIDKAFLRDWLVWIEREGPQGIGPLSAMKASQCSAANGRTEACCRRARPMRRI